ncbi:MAG TPA: TonB-dependent receptor, partial [Bryobacteraceae bacterium]
MFTRCLCSHLTFAAAIAIFTATMFGQSSSGTISGRVLDPSGSAVAGAEVRVTNQVSRSTRNFATNASGDFVFPDLEPGTYTLSVKAPGFRQSEKKDLHLAASDRLAIPDLQLEVGAVTEIVEVKATGAQVQTASAERSGLLDSKQIANLMSRGRDVMSLLQLLPGVVDDATGGDTLGAFGTPTMQGVRQQYNSLNIDGISGNTARGSNAQSPINMDAIAEVKVLMNSYTAEYGTASGGVINLITKSGTQEFHGGAYYYNRNEAMNANDFFNNRQGIARQRYRYNTVGYNVGGPIYWPNHFNAN